MKSNLGIRREPAVALLLERNHRGALNLERVARKFRLTRRERQTVDLLLQDLSAKQIAGRMDISPNTAKGFSIIRSVMIKVGEENRTGIIGEILQASKSITVRTKSYTAEASVLRRALLEFERLGEQKKTARE